MQLSREIIVTLGTRLPPSLGVFGRLQTLLKRPDTEFGEIVDLVRIDPALTFQVIKLANSALFGLRSRCESLEEAVGRVGFGDIHQMVGLAVSRQTFQGELQVYGVAAGRVWENAVAAAVLSAEFAALAGADAQSAYATGLLRNVGKVVINNHAPAARYPGEDTQPDAGNWERAVFGYDAAAVTAVLLDHWRFAPDMVATMAQHGRVDGTGLLPAGAARLHLACGIATGWGCQLPGESAGWRCDDALLAQAGVPADGLDGAVERARAQFAKCALIEWSSAA